MGRGERHKAEESIGRYGTPAVNATTGMSEQAGNLMYGAPSTAFNPQIPHTQKATSGTQGYPEEQRRQALTTGSGNYQQDFESVFPSVSLSSDQLWAKKDELAKMGMEVQTNASGVHHKVKLPDGSIIDVIGGAESGGNTRHWNVARGPGGSGTSGMSPRGGVAGQALQDYGGIQGRFGEFADTGGYSPEDISSIRARAVSPIRSIYSGARRDIDRQQALQGGYSPNRTASLAKMAREQSSTTADAATNAEAAIAQMVNQGRRFGVSGMSGMYGTTPGLANMFGNQALQAQQLQN